MPVLGVGGVFFRASDPDALHTWYREHLGIGAGCAAEGTGEPDEWSWKVQGGPLVFAPFEAGTDYWPAEKQFMLNLRVSDLDSLLEQLSASGIAVITRARVERRTGRPVRADPRSRRQSDRAVGTPGRDGACHLILTRSARSACRSKEPGTRPESRDRGSTRGSSADRLGGMEDGALLREAPPRCSVVRMR